MDENPSKWKLLGQAILVLLALATPIATFLFRLTGQLVPGTILFGVVAVACFAIDGIERRRRSKPL